MCKFQFKEINLILFGEQNRQICLLEDYAFQQKLGHELLNFISALKLQFKF